MSKIYKNFVKNTTYKAWIRDPPRHGDRYGLIKGVLTRLGTHMERSMWRLEEFYLDPRMT